MKFQHSAFIRRNIPELRKKLEDLGYKKSFVDGDCLHCNKIDYCAFNHGHLELSKKMKDEIIKKIIDGYTGTFDCGTANHSARWYKNMGYQMCRYLCVQES